jgi:hypothetical protein
MQIKLIDVPEVRTASVIRAIIFVLMMVAVRTSETSVNFNVTTRRYIPEDSKFHLVQWFTKYGYIM